MKKKIEDDDGASETRLVHAILEEKQKMEDEQGLCTRSLDRGRDGVAGNKNDRNVNLAGERMPSRGRRRCPAAPPRLSTQPAAGPGRRAAEEEEGDGGGDRAGRAVIRRGLLHWKPEVSLNREEEGLGRKSQAESASGKPHGWAAEGRRGEETLQTSVGKKTHKET